MRQRQGRGKAEERQRKGRGKAEARERQGRGKARQRQGSEGRRNSEARQK